MSRSDFRSLRSTRWEKPGDDKTVGAVPSHLMLIYEGQALEAAPVMLLASENTWAAR